MKFKNDFVTNSSSVSFIGWGIKIGKYFPSKTWRKIYDLAKQDPFYKDSTFEKFMFNNFIYHTHNCLTGTDLECMFNCKTDEHYIGYNGYRKGSDLEVQELIDNLKKIGFDDEDMKIVFIDEEWYG